MELIRPLYTVREDDICAWRDRNDLHFIQCACRLTEQVNREEHVSKRLEVKRLIKALHAENPTLGGRQDSAYIIRHHRPVAHLRRINHQAALFVRPHTHIRQGRVPLRCPWAVQSPKGNVRECFRHAIGAPYGMGEILQFACQRFVDAPAADDEMTYLSQALALLWHLQGVPHLHGNHRGKGEAPL